MNASDAVQLKASRLLGAGRCTLVQLTPEQIVAVVQGDHDRYRVEWTPTGWTCTCPARRGACSHVHAVKLVVLVRPDQDQEDGPAAESPSRAREQTAAGVGHPPPRGRGGRARARGNEGLADGGGA